MLCPPFRQGGDNASALTRDTQSNETLRNPQPGCIRRLDCQLGEAAQVLSDRRERELELGACRPPQSQSAHPKDPLQMGKEHLHFLSVAARLLIGGGPGNGTGDVARRLVNMPRDLAAR